jgi:rhodanese-related sulfurtransferase
MFSILRHHELKAMIDRNDDMVILDVLPEESFLKKHLPGAINIPAHAENFEVMVEKMIQDKSTPVVVYCANADCQASATSAQKIAEMGYKNVSDYENGLSEWEEEGYKMDE